MNPHHVLGLLIQSGIKKLIPPDNSDTGMQLHFRIPCAGIRREGILAFHVSKTGFREIILMSLLKRYVTKPRILQEKRIMTPSSVTEVQGMETQNPADPAGSPKKETPAGNIDEELRKILDQMRTRVSEVPAYIQLLRNGGLLERIRSAEFLGEIGEEQGVLPLIDALRDSSMTVQYVAAKSLGMLADKRAVDPLIRALKSEDKWVRLGAVHALGLIGDKKAVDTIIPLLDDPHHDLRAHAAWALGKLGDARAAEPLKRLLKDPKEDVRTEVQSALELLGVKN
jgi:hypothetical protein